LIGYFGWKRGIVACRFWQGFHRKAARFEHFSRFIERFRLARANTARASIIIRI
jgi:hypothetical protein